MTKFTKEQLILKAQENVEFFRERLGLMPQSQPMALSLRLAEIALAALTADDCVYLDPDGDDAEVLVPIPQRLMPPDPCLRCGTVSSRPNGEHYCHKGNK